MTIQQVVSILRAEKQEHLPSRFPCRAIMVKNVEQYCLLISELKKIGDIRVVQSHEIFSSFDVMPAYDNLRASAYQNEWVILTGVSEYLRLFSRKEASDRRFASLWSYQAPANSTGRIIIPLWGCEAQWFDTAIKLNEDLRQQDFYYDCTETDGAEPEMNLLVLSGMFEQHMDKLETLQGDFKIGLQEWFEYWENPFPDNHNFILLTRRYNSISTTSGKISVHVISDILSFMRENMPGADRLTESSCPEAVQNVLFAYALKGFTLEAAMLKALNVSAFSGIDLMGKWSALSQGEKEIIGLWLQLHPDNTYLCHCFAEVTDMNNVTEFIGHDIFQVRYSRPEWVQEYQELAAVLKLRPDDKFFGLLNEIPDYEARLDFLTNSTREERIYLLRMTGSWMRRDPAQVKGSEKLKKIYPELFAYLYRDVDEIDAELASYMLRYKSYKLENTLPDDEALYFGGMKTDVYDYRYSALSENIDDNTVVLWIDALGVEWLPLLKWGVEMNCDAAVAQIKAVMADLPTETCYNEQWKEMPVPHEKLDKLDKLAHKGVVDEPDYYACIEEQISFIAGIYQRINDLMKKYHRVIVTGDHGTSRLAARFFHVRDGISAPVGAKVCSHGRYCELSEMPGVLMSDIRIVKKQYAVFENYDHFRQSGFAAGVDDENAIYGEVHGGATPEEMLVPVMVLDSNREVPLTAAWEKPSVKIMMKKARLALQFSRPVSQLSAKTSGIEGTAVKNGGGLTWDVILPGIKPGSYKVSAVADGCILDLPEITILPALSGGEGDLP